MKGVVAQGKCSEKVRKKERREVEEKKWRRGKRES